MNIKYTVEFKKQAVALAKQDDRSINQVAQSLGVSDSSLYRWIELYADDATTATDTQEAQRIRELEREVRKLKEERDILKKAIKSFVLDT